MPNALPHPYFDVPTPTIIGHRGAAGVAPENTLASFRRGLADGAGIIESDVHGTADGIPVLMHDPQVDRTTDGRGALSALRWSEVQQLNAAHQFAGGWEAGAERIPSLREAFEAFPDARFNLEIKAGGKKLIRDIVELVVEMGREDRTLLVAGEDPIQAELRAVLAATGARPALGASLRDIVDVVSAALEARAPTTDSMALQIPESFGGQALVTRELVDHAHAHGITVHVWTINEPESMRALLDLGVDGLVTDYPHRLQEVLAARG